MSQLLEDIEKLVSPLVESEKAELVDITYQKTQGGWALCFYLDKPNGGITLDDCQYWSHKIGEVLDQADLISHAYSLEISSPGLSRPLKKLRDFEKYRGHRVQVKLFAALNGQKNYRGILVGADEESIRLDQVEGKGEVTLPRKQVAKSNLDPEIEV